MSKDYIIAPNHIRYELEEAERAVVAVNGILEDVIDPTFKGCTCRGLLDAWSEETNGDRGAAALKWMEQNFDATKGGATHTGRLPLSVLEQQHRLPGLSGHVVNVLYGILSDGLAVQVDGEVKRAVTHAHFPHCLNESLFHGGDRGDYFGLSGVVAQDSQELTVGRNNRAGSKPWRVCDHAGGRNQACRPGCGGINCPLLNCNRCLSVSKKSIPQAVEPVF